MKKTSQCTMQYGSHKPHVGYWVIHLKCPFFSLMCWWQRLKRTVKVNQKLPILQGGNCGALTSPGVWTHCHTSGCEWGWHFDIYSKEQVYWVYLSTFKTHTGNQSSNSYIYLRSTNEHTSGSRHPNLRIHLCAVAACRANQQEARRVNTLAFYD